MKQLYAKLSSFPPSNNELYEPRTFKQGKRLVTKEVLSQKARKYIADASTELAKQWAFENKLDPHKPHEVVLTFYMEKVENSTWPAKAKSRFVKRDVTNLIKVLEDVAVRASGVDDSAFFDLHIFKRLAKGEPYVEVLLREIGDHEIKER